MKIKFTTSVAGARFDYQHDEVVDLPNDVAREFIRAGQAVPARDDGLERAVTSAPERAIRRVRKAVGL